MFMCIVCKMNVVLTRSPFEAARSENDIQSDISKNNILIKLDHIDWKSISFCNKKYRFL